MSTIKNPTDPVVVADDEESQPIRAHIQAQTRLTGHGATDEGDDDPLVLHGGGEPDGNLVIESVSTSTRADGGGGSGGNHVNDHGDEDVGLDANNTNIADANVVEITETKIVDANANANTNDCDNGNTNINAHENANTNANANKNIVDVSVEIMETGMVDANTFCNNVENEQPCMKYSTRKTKKVHGHDHREKKKGFCD